MIRPEQTRILGFLVLLALGLQGNVALGHDHESAFETECIVCNVQQITALAVEPTSLESRLSAPTGAVVEGAPPVALQTPLTSRASRGPPA